MGATLVVLAAGLGSRFGGVKQMAAVDDNGGTLIDYSIYDAIRAGFDRIVCVVTPALEPAFHERIGRHIERHVELVYAHQTVDTLPSGYSVPMGRTKPWGTAHAVLCALPFLDGSFATINADDYYGQESYRCMADYLASDSPDHALVAYRLENTLSANGTVSRGVCQVAGGRLKGITERTALRMADGGAVDENDQFYPGDTPVSMNFWGFRPEVADAFRQRFPAFLDGPGAATREFYLPDVGGSLIPRVRVLPTAAKWKGVTYADDLPELRAYLAELTTRGVYPRKLWP